MFISDRAAAVASTRGPTGFQFFRGGLVFPLAPICLIAFVVGPLGCGAAPDALPNVPPVDQQRPAAAKAPAIEGRQSAPVARAPTNPVPRRTIPAAPSPAAPVVAAFERVWLCDLQETNVSVASGQFGKGLAGCAPGAIRINGTSSHHGLGMRADAHVEYALGKKYHTFRTSVAMNDSAGTKAGRPVEFRVVGDGKELWKSYPFYQAGSGEPCLLDVTGVDVLRLEAQFVPNTTGNEETAHAAWIEPYVSDEAVTPEALRLFSPERFNVYQSRRVEISKIRQLFDTERFADLEALAKQWRANDPHCGAWPMLFSFYQALENPTAPTEAAWQEHLARLEKWRTSNPESITPLIVLGDFYISYAWAARGGDIAMNVPKDAWPKFEDRLGKAREYLEKAETIGGDPEVYCGLIQVAQGQSAEPDDVLALVDNAHELRHGPAPESIRSGA
jgi:NPCBM/NEW2 domain/Domain of unknown function (DUF4034)